MVLKFGVWDLGLRFACLGLAFAVRTYGARFLGLLVGVLSFGIGFAF